jgi:hypothetical protein
MRLLRVSEPTLETLPLTPLTVLYRGNSGSSLTCWATAAPAPSAMATATAIPIFILILSLLVVVRSLRRPCFNRINVGLRLCYGRAGSLKR